MSLILVSIIFLIQTSCGLTPSGEAPSTNLGHVDLERNSQDQAEHSRIEPLPEIPLMGTQFRLADALALTQMYSRVFTKSRNNNRSWNTRCSNIDFCQKSMFETQEAEAMSSLDLQAGVASFQEARSHTLKYMRNLRSGLERECRSLVTRELNSARNEDVSENVLIMRDAPPEAQHLHDFLKRILGIYGTAIEVDSGAKEYAQQFREAFDNGGGIQEGYVTVCIAIAMDPTILVY